MRDIDKIKEKNEKDEVKSILGFVLLFLIVFGIITFSIIKLTNQYFTLKKQLEESKNVQLTTIPGEEGKKLEYKLDGDKIKVSELKEVAEKAAENSLKEDLSDDNNSQLMSIIEPKNVNKKDVKKETSSANLKKSNDTNQQSDIKIDSDKKLKSKQNTKQIEHKKNSHLVVNKAAPSEAYVLQLMALKDESDAKNVIQKYKGELKDIYYIKVDLGAKGVWYRVRCCSSLTLDEAKSKLEEIDKKYKIKGFIVKN